MKHSTSPTPTAEPRRRRTLWIALSVTLAAAAVITAVAVVLVGTSTAADPLSAPAVFVTQPGYQPGAKTPCLLHQTDEPNAAYKGGTYSQTRPQLTFLAYYTAAGKEPFCDGQPASDIDKAWAQLYVQLTTSSENVTTILG